MEKFKLDYKLVNFLLILLIILTIYQTKELWLNILNLTNNILKPLLISLMISYVLNIYLRILNKKFNKLTSIILLLTTIFLIIYTLIFKLLPTIIIQLKEGINGITYILKTISLKYNINIIDTIGKLKQIDELIPNINIISNILKYISLTLIVISITIYMFIDWNKIIDLTKEILKNKKIYNYLSIINKELEKYTRSFLLLSLLNMIEYLTIFIIIKHPNYLLLGLLAGILSIIPIIGGITTNIIALSLAFITNYKLFIRTIIGILVLTILDGYIISPLVYNKSNKIHPIISILSIYIGSKLFGLLGTILALPLLIITKTTYQYKKIEKNEIYSDFKKL